MEQFLLLLMVCSALTSLVTEAGKKMLEGTKFNPPLNLVAGVVAVIVAGLVSAGYLITESIALSPQIWVCIIALVVLSWLCAMLGYDKVIQTLKQIKGA